jgi:hypothetical protein
MKNDVRIPKGEARDFRDFVDHVTNLKTAIARLESDDAAAYKDILTNLRTLVGKKRIAGYDGLIFRIAATHAIPLLVQMRRFRPDISKKNLEEYLEVISLEAYLATACFNGGREFSYGDLVWELASQDASHADPGLSAPYAAGEFVIIGKFDSNSHLSLLIGRTVASVAEVSIAAVLRKKANQAPEPTAPSGRGSS